MTSTTRATMDLLNPAALTLLALVPLLFLLHLGRRRKVVRRVPSLTLWEGTGGRRPRTRLRRLRDPLLWLQALVLVAVIVALARPVSESGAGRDVVFVFDASASMGAREAGGSRFDLARERALGILDDLGRRDRVQLVRAGPRPHAVTGFLDEGRELRRRIRRLQPAEAPADLPAALVLALAATEGPVYVFTDAAVPASLRPDRVRVARVGEAMDNAAVTRLATRPSRQSPFDHDVFAEVANFASGPRPASFAIEGDGRVLWSGELALAPGERRRIAVDGAAVPGEVVRAVLGGDDALAADDRAWAPVPPRTVISVLLVTAGNRFVETALAVDPAVALTVVPPREAAAALARGGHDLAVLDGWEPEPPGPPRALVIRPPSAAEVAAGRALRRPELTPRAPDHPVLAAVGFGDVAVDAASVLAVPPGGRVLVEGSGEPVLVAWEREGRRRVVVGFDVTASTWPRALSFPVFVANALRWLAPGRDAGPVQVAAGQPLEQSLPPAFLGLSEVAVEDPLGEVSTVQVAGGSVVFADTERTGIYSVRGDGFEGVFAVNLFSDEESDLRSAAAPADVDPVPWSSASLARGREASLHVLLAALLFLLAEWVLYCRRGAA